MSAQRNIKLKNQAEYFNLKRQAPQLDVKMTPNKGDLF
jgi:hypothetical protein